MSYDSSYPSSSNIFKEQVVYIDPEFGEQLNEIKRLLNNHGGTYTEIPNGDRTIHLLRTFKGVITNFFINFPEIYKIIPGHVRVSNEIGRAHV